MERTQGCESEMDEKRSKGVRTIKDKIPLRLPLSLRNSALSPKGREQEMRESGEETAKMERGTNKRSNKQKLDVVRSFIIPV